MRDVELISEYRRREVDLVTDHQVGRPRVVQLEVPANAPTRDLCGVMPAQDTVFVELVWLQQRPPLLRSALEVAPARGELPVDFEGAEPARFQRRQIARMTYKGHRVPGIPQNMGDRDHGLGVAGTPDKTEQDPHPTPFDAFDDQATVMRALKRPNVQTPTGQ